MIVTIASIMGMVGSCSLADYCASKHAQIGMHESLRMELMGTGVETLLVCPWGIRTGMFSGLYESNDWSAKVGRILFPMLTPECVIDSIVSAIEHRDRKLVLPHYMTYLIYCLKMLLPVDL